MPSFSPNFYKKILEVSNNVGMKPEHLLNVLYLESGLNPAARNKGSDASGLGQIVPSTLKGLGFTGSQQDFRNLAAEQQLDYVQKLIQSHMQSNGGPFKSAEQYYVAHFWPVGLKLSGVKNEDLSTPIVEKNPRVLINRKTGKKYSKKYLDLGIKIDGNYERKAYNENSILDADKDGKITYGDLKKVLQNTASSAGFQTVLNDLKSSTGYQHTEQYPSTMIAKKPTNNVNEVLDNYLKLIAASEKNNKKFYKRFLPSHNFLIKIESNNYTNSIEFSRILSAVLEEELLATAYTHTNGQQVEVECKIAGPIDFCNLVIHEITKSTTESFQDATRKLGVLFISAEISNNCSQYNILDFKTAQMQYQKFLQRMP